MGDCERRLLVVGGSNIPAGSEKPLPGRSSALSDPVHASGGLDVCLMVEGQEGVDWAQWRELAGVAEECGFHGLFCSDHYLSEQAGSNRVALEAWGTICALAAVTTRIRLGTIVSPASFRHPSVLAKLVATADHVSGGRVELGMGAGWFEEEHSAYGFPFLGLRDRMAVLEEQVEIIACTWGQRRFSFAGSHYTIAELDAWPKPLQQPSVPLVIGGTAGPRSVAIAARWADEYNTPLAPDGELSERRAAFLRAWERAGRDTALARFSVMAPVLVGVDRDELKQRARRVARFQGADGSDPAGYLRHNVDACVIGSVDQVVSRLRGLHAMGVNRVLLESIDHTDLDMIRLIGREVIPAVREP